MLWRRIKEQTRYLTQQIAKARVANIETWLSVCSQETLAQQPRAEAQQRVAYAAGQTVACGWDSLRRTSVESTTKIDDQKQGPNLSRQSAKIISKHELELINNAITDWDKKEKSITWTRRTAEIQTKVAIARIMKQANKEAHTLKQALTDKTAEQQKMEIDRRERANTLIGSITPGGAIIGIVDKWVHKITKKVTQPVKLQEKLRLINKYGKKLDAYRAAGAYNQSGPDVTFIAQPLQNTHTLKGGYGESRHTHTYEPTPISKEPNEQKIYN